MKIFLDSFFRKQKMGDDDRQIKYIKVGMDFTQMVTNRILENLEGEEKEEQLDQMRRVMMDYVKMEAEYNCSKEVESTGIRI